MVDERLADGRRIAQLLASEADGRDDGGLSRLSVVDADRDVEATVDGAFAYGIDRERGDESERVTDVYVHPDRARVEVSVGHDEAVTAAEREGLRVRPRAADPPKTLVFVESGADVKRAIAVIEAAVS